MTWTEAKRIAGVLKEAKPNPETCIVAERLLWGRLAAKLHDTCMAAVPYGNWREADWNAAAGLEGD